MLLSHIAPGPAGFELRTLDCVGCNHVKKTLSRHPMKSGDVGWFVGELQAPA
jgi:hypothetical protein